MAVRKGSLSVLVVDEEPEILSFFARILDANGMRALLARNAKEAMGIANRGYVPIDVVLTDVVVALDSQSSGSISGAELVDRLRELRPEVRALFMSASLDEEVIRVRLTERSFETTTIRSENVHSDDEGLIESIRKEATRPLVHRMHGMSAH
jgi:CheY-like chemotaxis protein